MSSKTVNEKPIGLGDPTTMAELVRNRIYASLDDIQESTAKAKTMRDLVALAEDLGDAAAVDAGRGALTGLAAAAHF